MNTPDGLFPPPPVTPVERPAGVPADAPAGVRYTSYRPKQRVLCDDCIQEIHDKNPDRAPYPRGARYRRRQGDQTQVLCTQHRMAREDKEHQR